MESNLYNIENRHTKKFLKLHMSEQVNRLLMAHKHIIGYSVP